MEAYACTGLFAGVATRHVLADLRRLLWCGTQRTIPTVVAYHERSLAYDGSAHLLHGSGRLPDLDDAPMQIPEILPQLLQCETKGEDAFHFVGR
jgi:hypothetical protein